MKKMRKITTEEFFEEMEMIKKENDTTDYLWLSSPSLWGNFCLLSGHHTRYKTFLSSYKIVKEHFEKWYKTKIELPDFINKKAVFLSNNYRPQEVKYPKFENQFYSDFPFADPFNFDEKIEKQLGVIREYFSDKKRNYVFTWETYYLIVILYYDKRKGLNLTESLFGESPSSDDATLNELKRNAEYILRGVKAKNELNLSLFLWTIYKTYYYYLEKDSGFVIQRECFSLIEYLLEFCFLFHEDDYRFSLSEKTITIGRWPIRELCFLLSASLIHEIIDCFPYANSGGNKMMIGCYSDQIESMDTFDGFLKTVSLHLYDGDSNGYYRYDEKQFVALPVEKDYDKLIKKIFDEQQLVDYLKQFNSIAWYPSASHDSLSMACLSNKSLKKYGIPKNEVPDCFIFTDYDTFYDQRDNKRFFLDLEENNDEVSFDNPSDGCHATAFNVRELGQLSIPFDKSLVTHDCDKYYGRVFLADVLIEHPKIGKTIAKLVYIIAENTAFAFDFLIKNDIRIKYVIHSNYGYGFGGGISNGTFICNILKDLGARYFASDINQNSGKDIANSYLNDDQRKTLPVLKTIVDFNHEYKWYGYDNTILYEITGYKRSDDKNESGK